MAVAMISGLAPVSMRTCTRIQGASPDATTQHVNDTPLYIPGSNKSLCIFNIVNDYNTINTS